MMTSNVQGSSQSVTKYNKVEELMGKFLPVVKDVLPRFVPPEAFARTALHYAKTNPNVLACHLDTFFGALMESGQLGLMPDGILGDAWVVPYKRMATLVPGYQGLMNLAFRSGMVSNIGGKVVYEKDKWEYQEGDHPKIIHIPSPDEDRGSPIGVYSIAQLTDPNAPPARFWLWWWEVDQIRKDFSKTVKEDTPWNTHRPSMAVKSAIRRNCKFLPRSLHGDDIGLRRAVSLDEKLEANAPIIQSWDLPRTGPVVQGSSLSTLMNEVGNADGPPDIAQDDDGSGSEGEGQNPPQEAQDPPPGSNSAPAAEDKGEEDSPPEGEKPKLRMGSTPKPEEPPKTAQQSGPRKSAAEIGLEQLRLQMGTLFLQKIEKIPNPQPGEAENVINEICEDVFGRPWERVAVAKRSELLTAVGLRAGEGKGLQDEDYKALTSR